MDKIEGATGLFGTTDETGTEASTAGEEQTVLKGLQIPAPWMMKEDEVPVVFYRTLEPVAEEDVEEEPDIELDDLLFGASSDEAFLRLARLFVVVKGEPKKAAKTYSRLIEDFPSSTVRFEAFYELGYLRYRKNRIAEARLLLEYVVKNRSAAVTLKDSARELLEEIESIYERGARKHERVSIGALLPLEGKYEKMGSAALRGILLATGAFEAGGLPVDVHVRDTGGGARGAKDAIEELVNGERVRALIGPMLSSTADEAAKYAQNKQTPIVALSQRDRLTGIGRYVFRNSLLPARQAALVASYAYNVLGNRTFVILYPRSRYGSTLARAFAAEVERLGGIVINKTSYTPGSKDLNSELRDLFLIEEKETIKGRRTIKEYSPTVEADALYIPDYYQTVSMVVSYLEYFNIGELQLLGSNGWNSAKLVELGGKGVEGALFADGFFAQSQREATLGFLEKYRAMYGAEPGVVESQAYDATKLLLAAISKNGYEWMDRDSLRRNLLETDGVTGSTGSISIEEGGEVVKKLFLLKVERGKIVEVSVDGLRESGTPEVFNGGNNGAAERLERGGWRMGLTHTDESGKAKMVDVSVKDVTIREATATGTVLMKRETLELILSNEVKKGDVLGVARLAGIMAAKRTADIIPLCHPIGITGVDVEFETVEEPPSVEITATARIASQTGVEMEALTAVSVSALTIYDMCKAVDKGMELSGIRLLKKSGGRSGTYVAPDLVK